MTWSRDDMVEIILKEPDDFLKVKETLTRMGVASKDGTRLYQSCHILHKQGRYFVVHFKEMFALEGKPANIQPGDYKRRNTIATLLDQWLLAELVKPIATEDLAPVKEVKIISHADKARWTLIPKYDIGNKC